jgi:hypothetical protein
MNKTSPRAHMESDLGMLGVPGKLAKRKNFTRPKEKIEKK